MLSRMAGRTASPMFRKQLGRSMRAARIATYGDVQQECANALGVAQSDISRWERGKSLPRLDLLVSFANNCNTTVEALLGGASRPQAEQLLLGLDTRARTIVVDLVDYLREVG